jgi:hypothetical protein
MRIYSQLAPPHRQLECHLTRIIGNARLLKLEMPDLPISISRYIDTIAETAQRISALLHRPQGDTATVGDTGTDPYR